MATFEDLKWRAEESGFDGKEKTKFLTQGWKMIQEAEERKFTAEAEK